MRMQLHPWSIPAWTGIVDGQGCDVGSTGVEQQGASCWTWVSLDAQDPPVLSHHHWCFVFSVHRERQAQPSGKLWRLLYIVFKKKPYVHQSSIWEWLLCAAFPSLPTASQEYNDFIRINIANLRNQDLSLNLRIKYKRFKCKPDLDLKVILLYSSVILGNSFIRSAKRR